MSNDFNFEYSENTKKWIDGDPFNWKTDLEATITGYQSPITMIAHELETKIESDCVKAVQRYGFNVDAEELCKALNYDREQYQKGYADAKKDYARPQGEWIIEPHSMIMRCSLCGNEETAKSVGTINADKHFCSNCGAKMIKEAEEC